MYIVSYAIIFYIFILYYLKKNKNIIINDNEIEFNKNKIKNIYYSNNDGNILRTTLSELTKDENQHITKFYRNRNKNNIK